MLWDQPATSPSQLPSCSTCLFSESDTSSHSRPLNKRHTDTVCYFITCLLGTVAGHYSLPAWRSVPLTIYYLCLSTCPKLQWLLPPSTCQASLATRLLWRLQAPALLETSHGCCVVLPLKHGRKKLFSSSSAFSCWDPWKSHLYPLPSNWSSAFFTDKSRTNWGTRP